HYSYIFDGSAQILDHILVTQALDAFVTDVAFGRGNADASWFQYEDVPNALRSSDHDGLVLYIDPSGYDGPSEQPIEPLPTATEAPQAAEEAEATAAPTEAATEEPTEVAQVEPTDVPEPTPEAAATDDGGQGGSPIVTILTLIVVAIVAAAVSLATRGRARANNDGGSS
ncbi:MAG: hypothetical protein GYB68_03095, partial [Chloroflexi bacterium]|nr:hypothetical protein [Chloroflexota bacterium]